MGIKVFASIFVKTATAAHCGLILALGKDIECMLWLDDIGEEEIRDVEPERHGV